MTHFSANQANSNNAASESNFASKGFHNWMQAAGMTMNQPAAETNSNLSHADSGNAENFNRHSNELSSNAHRTTASASVQPLSSFNQTMQQAMTEFSAVQQALETDQTLPELQEKMQLSMQLVQTASTEFNQQLASAIQSNLKAIRQQSLAIAQLIRRAADMEEAFQITVTQVRDSLQADRVLVYRFSSPNQGIVVAEARESSWTPTLGETLSALLFGSEQAAEYGSKQAIAIHDVLQTNPSPYWKQLLDKFQVRASLAVPLWIDGQVWGLLVAHQCQQARSWQEIEASLGRVLDLWKRGRIRAA